MYCQFCGCSKVKSLDVVFNSSSNTEKQFSNNIPWSAYFNLHNISQRSPSFTANSTAILVHALVPSRIDYCNTILSDLSNKIFHTLQLVQNGAVLVITRTPSVEDVTPVLQQPYWLTVKYHINFKFLHLTFKYPFKAPYFFDILHIAAPSHTLRSSCAVTFIIPPDRLTTMDIPTLSCTALAILIPSLF